MLAYASTAFDLDEAAVLEMAAVYISQLKGSTAAPAAPGANPVRSIIDLQYRATCGLHDICPVAIAFHLILRLHYKRWDSRQRLAAKKALDKELAARGLVTTPQVEAFEASDAYKTELRKMIDEDAAQAAEALISALVAAKAVADLAQATRGGGRPACVPIALGVFLLTLLITGSGRRLLLPLSTRL
jgi:hypothetical protein